MTKNRTRHRRPILRIELTPMGGLEVRGVESPYFAVQVGALQPVFMNNIESVDRWINMHVRSGLWAVEVWNKYAMFIYPTVHNSTRNEPLQSALARGTAKAYLRLMWL